MRIDAIVVGDRHRKDMGDIDALAQSIADIGLLHPIVVTPDGRLIAGARRLEACKRLGLLDVPTTIIDLAEADAISHVTGNAYDVYAFHAREV